MSSHRGFFVLAGAGRLSALMMADAGWMLWRLGVRK